MRGTAVSVMAKPLLTVRAEGLRFGLSGSGGMLLWCTWDCERWLSRTHSSFRINGSLFYFRVFFRDCCQYFAFSPSSHPQNALHSSKHTRTHRHTTVCNYIYTWQTLNLWMLNAGQHIWGQIEFGPTKEPISISVSMHSGPHKEGSFSAGEWGCSSCLDALVSGEWRGHWEPSS